MIHGYLLTLKWTHCSWTHSDTPCLGAQCWWGDMDRICCNSIYKCLISKKFHLPCEALMLVSPTPAIFLRLYLYIPRKLIISSPVSGWKIAILWLGMSGVTSLWNRCALPALSPKEHAKPAAQHTPLALGVHAWFAAPPDFKKAQNCNKGCLFRCPKQNVKFVCIYIMNISATMANHGSLAVTQPNSSFVP
jgi:hypothetical protein